MNDQHTHGSQPNQITVTSAEAGQKLFQFLTRRTGLPGGAVMRLVRTGQVRVDGKRAKPYMRLAEGALVRIPPKLAAEITSRTAPASYEESHAPVHVLAEEYDILAVMKPAGLPTHGGTGHFDSLASRLAAARSGASFAPTPAHRLDKDTSGVLLMALSYAALTALQRAFQEHRVDKRYLAWVAGRFPEGGPYRLEDMVGKSGPSGRERMHANAVGGKRALSDVRLIEHRGDASLVEIRIHTGRTHQIRVQLASRGHPICGDAKYGGSTGASLFLHAWRVALPAELLPGAPVGYQPAYDCLPDWTNGFAVAEEPDEWPERMPVSWTF